MNSVTALQEWAQARSALAASLTGHAVGIRVGGRREVSGFRWRRDLVVTAAEAVGGCEQVTVLTGDAEQAAPVVACDPGTDVAVVRLTDSPDAPTVLDASMQPGGVVLFVGRSRRGPLVSFGSVRLAGPAWRSQRGSTIDQRLEFEGVPDARFEGALVGDLDGHVRAMLVPGPRRSLLGIPASTIERVVAAVETHGYLPRPYLGLRLQPLWLDAATRQRWGRQSRSVPVVAAVEAGSPAEAAGILTGDLLEKLDGAELGDVDAILWRLQQAPIGQTLSLILRRGGQPQQTQVEIADWRARRSVGGPGDLLQSQAASP